VLLVSLLRHKGIPARVRTGTARYFYPDGSRLEDHWICEFWREAEGRWQQTDAQIDDVLRKAMRLPFDPTDIPEGQFLTGWPCYDELSSGHVKPEAIGFPPDYCGMGYVLNKMLADLAALTGQELLAWAGWGIGGPDGGTVPGDKAVVERMVELLKSIDQPAMLQEARDFMVTHERLKRPDGYSAGKFQKEWLS
ncbi:transglutaminase-like domain-containing protein, partial [Candidatus Bipolaricaulota bacterium]|nr:transglutaminase-like domain-containing protein [Candidatus Bipolaricaulota bacterium]